MTNRQLLKEIDEWEKENIIDAYAADRLRERYSSGGKVTLVTIFSVLSSVLVGAGVILLFATNWQNMPLGVKAAVSFLPMLVGQAAAVFTVIKKYGNTVFRECVSIAYTAGICATLAMVGNSFDIGNSAKNYVFICAVLVLPVFYILSAVSPLVFYFAGVIFWAAKAVSRVFSFEFAALIFLIAVGLIFIFRVKREENCDNGRIKFVKTLNVLAAFAFTVVAVGAADLYSNAVYLAFFALIFALSDSENGCSEPCGILGLLGVTAVIGIFSMGDAWYAPDSGADTVLLLAKAAPAVLLYAAAVVISLIKGFDRIKTAVLISAGVCVVLSCLCCVGILSGGALCAVLANAAMLAVGIALIVFGTDACNAFLTNVGIISVGAVVIMRFFDWDFDIFAKGVAFIAAGVALFIVNRRLAKKKKVLKDSGEAKTQ